MQTLTTAQLSQGQVKGGKKKSCTNISSVTRSLDNTHRQLRKTAALTAPAVALLQLWYLNTTRQPLIEHLTYLT